MSAKKTTQKSAKSTTVNKKSKGFTDEERAAMKERAQELKAEARRGPRANKADGEGDVLAKIAEMMAKGTYASISLATADVDGTFERLQASGAEVVQEPTEQPYGVRDCAVRDPAGNLIRIQELR